MELDANLESWDYQTILKIVEKRDSEPDIYDFKEVLTTRPRPGVPDARRAREDHNFSIVKTACSMANSSGGFILFGIADPAVDADNPSKRIVGIRITSFLAKEFGDKVQDIQPSLHFETSPKPIPLPNDPGQGVFVVHVPLSPLRPHVVRSSGVFYRRGAGGAAEQMDYYGVRDLMMLTHERLQKATLLRLEIAQYRVQIRLMHDMGADVDKCLLRFDTSAFKILVAETCGLLSGANDLLRQLLRLAPMANVVNQQLQTFSSPSLFYPRQQISENIHGQIRHLDEICVICEDGLEAVFGPLGL